MARMNLAESLFVKSVLRVLEVGCGQGVGAELILGRFIDAEVVGVDLDPKMIRRARSRLASRRDRVEVQVGDVCSLPFEDGSFDVIVDFAAVHHVPDWRSALSEIARLLGPGGNCCSRTKT